MCHTTILAGVSIAVLVHRLRASRYMTGTVGDVRQGSLSRGCTGTDCTRLAAVRVRVTILYPLGTDVTELRVQS